ncbi:MAG: methylated-DNA--[protein]-cysteine S-methyltransferase [Candidatus Eisenbacteria bacterium]
MTGPARKAPRARKPVLSKTYQRIYAAVRRIPRGRVATYGDVARLAGMPRQPRLVGYALHATPEGIRLPWHRVVNAQGRISLGRGVAGGELPQRFRLEREGVEFGPNGRIPLDSYRWDPSKPVRRSAKPRRQ